MDVLVSEQCMTIGDDDDEDPPAVIESILPATPTKCPKREEDKSIDEPQVKKPRATRTPKETVVDTSVAASSSTPQPVIVAAEPNPVAEKAQAAAVQRAARMAALFQQNAKPSQPAETLATESRHHF